MVEKETQSEQANLASPAWGKYLVGGNLLNEQDRIAGWIKEHAVEPPPAAPPAEDPVEEAAEEDDDVELPVPGAAIPEHHANSITEDRHTHGGGTIPPGSADAGHTPRRRW